MSLEYIKKYYNVPATKGQRIRYTGGGESYVGKIVGANGPHITVQFDDGQQTHILHPTWKVEYLTDQQPAE